MVQKSRNDDAFPSRSVRGGRSVPDCVSIVAGRAKPPTRTGSVADQAKAVIYMDMLLAHMNPSASLLNNILGVWRKSLSLSTRRAGSFTPGSPMDRRYHTHCKQASLTFPKNSLVRPFPPTQNLLSPPSPEPDQPSHRLVLAFPIVFLDPPL